MEILELKKNFKLIGIFVAGLWGIFILSQVLPLQEFGIVPRTSFGLIGVITSPLLHGNLHHLISNSVALLTFAPIFALVEGKGAAEKIIMLTVLTGLLTWTIGRPANHIGASGLIFALYGYLISFGIFKKHFAYTALSLFLVISYGYMIFGVFPTRSYISWEGHLSGFVAGIIVAKLSSKFEKNS